MRYTFVWIMVIFALLLLHSWQLRYIDRRISKLEQGIDTLEHDIGYWKGPHGTGHFVEPKDTPRGAPVYRMPPAGTTGPDLPQRPPDATENLEPCIFNWDGHKWIPMNEPAKSGQCGVMDSAIAAFRHHP